jgi:ABC-type nickel/cobalt efflux system permease component RcnA
MFKFMVSVGIGAIVLPVAWVFVMAGIHRHADGVELMMVAVAGALLGGLAAIKQVR